MYIWNISEFDHLRDVKEIKFKEEKVGSRRFTIVSYMVANKELWNIPGATECRGITFDDIGIVVCRPFEKFFNLNENEQSQASNFDWKGIFELTEKLDGSMVTPVLVQETSGRYSIRIKTKKSFYSTVALTAQEEFDKDQHLKDFCREMLLDGYTPIFEFLHPGHKIVLNYSEPRFVLLAIRNMETGSYICPDFVSSRIAKVQTFQQKPLNKILDDAKTLTEFEGYVVMFPNGQRVKIKTDWYLSMHHLTTDIRVRDVADAVIDETFDDLVAKAVEMGLDPAKLESIQQKVINELYGMQLYAEEIADKCQQEGMTPKEVAEKYKGDKLFSAIITEFRGLEFDYKKVWKTQYRQNYSLMTVYNENFGISE